MKIATLQNIVSESVSHDPSILKKVIAKNGDIPHITQIAQTILKPGDIVKEHVHADLYEVFYVESGEMTVTVNGVQTTLSNGSVITIEPGNRHQFENRSGSQVKMFYFGVLAD